MGRNKDIRSESDDISGKVVITMAKKHVGIGIAAIAAGAGAATYMKKKISEKSKRRHRWMPGIRITGTQNAENR